ncbi:MAG: flagellar hook-associated protein FlgL [Deltaproteobacteria bacterium]|nr:flagellar hook-associated protein FlgL [Deltaproteobacteria bacterium]
MKIATRTLYENIINNLGRASIDLSKANETVSTGRKINTASDDPLGLLSVLDIRSSMANIEQVGRNITTGKLWINVSESSLNGAYEFLYQAKALLVSVNNADVEPDQAADTLNGYINQILSLANSRVNDSYIFAGTKTDTKPFSFDEANPDQVNYNGNADPFSVKVGIDTRVTVGANGEEIFGEMFNILMDAKLGIDGGTYDTEDIEAAIDDIEDQLDTLTAAISDVTFAMIQFDVKEKILEDLHLAYEDEKALIENADINEAVVNLKMKQLVYETAMSSSASVMALSIVDYL